MAEKIDNSDVSNEDIATITPPEVIGPARGGLMKRTLKELEALEIYLKDVFSMEGITINLTWNQVIKLVNYNAGKTVLNWDHTFEESLEILKIFLV